MNRSNDNTVPRGSTPVPDPTVLTTQQLTIGLAALREILETRLDAMDVATELNKAATDTFPRRMDERICAIQKLNNEKFIGVEKQFAERDIRSNTVAELGQKALEAALSAAKEAVGKTEVSFTKQIDNTLVQIQAEKKATDDKIDDVKSRLTAIETGLNTRHIVTTEDRGSNQWMIGILISLGLALLGNAITLIYLFNHK